MDGGKVSNDATNVIVVAPDGGRVGLCKFSKFATVAKHRAQ